MGRKKTIVESDPMISTEKNTDSPEKKTITSSEDSSSEVVKIKSPFDNKTEKVEFCIHSEKEKRDERLKKLIQEETKMVRGRFRNIKDPGYPAHIFLSKYPGVKDFDMDMYDGKTYDIPLYVARFLNGVDVCTASDNKKINTCAVPMHAWTVEKDNISTSPIDGAGLPVPICSIQRWDRRYAFESFEFDSES